MGEFKPYLLSALDNHEDSQVCVAAIGVIADLCRAFEANIATVMDEIMEKLFGILQVKSLINFFTFKALFFQQDPNVKRVVKSQVLNVFGDVALALNTQYTRYLDMNMKWLAEAIAAAQITNPV